MYFRQNYPTSKLDDNDTGAEPVTLRGGSISVIFGSLITALLL